VSKKEIEINMEKEETVQKETARRKSNLPAVLTKKERKKAGVDKDKAVAHLKYVRLSSRKVRVVMDLIRNKNLREVYGILKFTPKAASPVLYKLIKSAEANAQVKNLDSDNLFLAEAFASQGPTLKRIMPRAQGRAARIHKRTSHITVVLKERE
jgi:large subunit ribosomal protein L22